MFDLADALIPPPYAVIWQSGPSRIHAGRDGAGRVRVTATRDGVRLYDVRLTAVGGGCDAEEWETALSEARRAAGC